MHIKTYDDDDSSLNKKPQIIVDYNKTKTIVDTMGKMVKIYSVKGMTCRWLLTELYNTNVHVSAMNAYILWFLLNAECDQKLKKRWNFIIRLAEELVGYEESVAVPTRVSDVLHKHTYEPPKKERNQKVMFVPLKKIENHDLCVQNACEKGLRRTFRS